MKSQSSDELYWFEKKSTWHIYMPPQLGRVYVWHMYMPSAGKVLSSYHDFGIYVFKKYSSKTYLQFQLRNQLFFAYAIVFRYFLLYQLFSQLQSNFSYNWKTDRLQPVVFAMLPDKFFLTLFHMGFGGGGRKSMRWLRFFSPYHNVSKLYLCDESEVEQLICA